MATFDVLDYAYLEYKDRNKLSNLEIVPVLFTRWLSRRKTKIYAFPVTIQKSASNKYQPLIF